MEQTGLLTNSAEQRSVEECLQLTLAFDGSGEQRTPFIGMF